MLFRSGLAGRPPVAYRWPQQATVPGRPGSGAHFHPGNGPSLVDQNAIAALAVGILALLFAGLLARRVVGSDAGTDAMRAIADATVALAPRGHRPVASVTTLCRPDAPQ
jgi:hypothetical protein